MSKEELTALRRELKAKYHEFQDQGFKAGYVQRKAKR